MATLLGARKANDQTISVARTQFRVPYASNIWEMQRSCRRQTGRGTKGPSWLEHHWASGCVGCSDDGCGGGGGDDDDDEGTGHVTIKAAAVLPSNGVRVLLGRSLQPQACVTHVCASQQTCV